MTHFAIGTDNHAGVNGGSALTLRELLSLLDSAFSDAIEYTVNRYEEELKPGWLEGMHYFYTRRQLLRKVVADAAWDEVDNVFCRLETPPSSVLLFDQIDSLNGIVFSFRLPDGPYNISVGHRVD